MTSTLVRVLGAGGLVLAAAIAGVVARGAQQDPAPDRKPAPRAALGINLAEVSYHASEYPFVDVFRQSRPFLHQRERVWSVDEPLALRDDGYPASLRPGHFAGTLIFRDVEHFPAGDYVCLYDGRGKIDFGFAARAVQRSPGRVVVRVTPQKSGIYLKLTATATEDPVRNIRLILPGFEASHREQPFHPAFLARWKGFEVLRFMGWMRTNDSPVVTWEDRNAISFQTQAATTGVAPELIAALANTLAADPWLCIPHRANDDYVRGLARLMRATLAPDRRVVLEYSNEIWNSMFDQADYCRERGLALELAGDRHAAGLRFASQRAVQVFRLWEAEFAGTDRLVRVIAAQNANPATSREMLRWNDAHRHADALAVAPYFGPAVAGIEQARETARLSVDDLLAQCDPSIDKALRRAARQLREAQAFGLPLIAYEAGQHMVGTRGAENHEPLTTLLWAANRHPRMAALYDRYTQGWIELGGGLLCAFESTSSFGKWGSWGHAEHYGPGSDDAPKLQALVRFRDRLAGTAPPR